MGTIGHAWAGAALVAGSLSACAPDHDPADPAVAWAYDDKLYWSDLRQVIPMNATPEDSAALAHGYIDNWLREHVLVDQAERNLTDADKDVEARLRDYRNSLIIYAYEQALVDQKLDTVIPADEVRRYYEENGKNFQLKDDIVRVRWFKVRDEDKRTLSRLERSFRSDKDEDMHELEVWLAERGIPINDTGEDWTTFHALQQQVPIRTDNATDWLTHHAKVLLEDSSGTYFVHLLEHRLQESISPLPLVEQDIRSILLNQRKVKLIERMRDDLYEQALSKDEVGTF
ncbi:MAG: hypothetical protein H6597_03610 [Flavobacteriales bacterium]|nr:hypothetical protein [Flavobacteriales bacterium]MCB9193595.1 hypothetical protein [Flavobacteriales bacterium]